MKELIGIIIFVILLVIGIPLSCQYMEEPYSYYEHYTKDLHKGGWVLDIFPKDITEIHEQHDIDTNEVWLKFTLGKEAIDLSNFKKIDKSDINNKKPFFTKWWFRDLPNHYNYYQGSCEGKNQASTLAISTESKVVYWWCK